MSRIRRFLGILTPFTPTPTSPTLLCFLLLLPMVSGRVRLLVDMSRPWSRRGTQIVSSRMFFLELCLCFPLTFLNSYDVNFVGMVIPGDDLEVKLCHIGMHNGNIVVGIEMTNSQGEKV